MGRLQARLFSIWTCSEEGAVVACRCSAHDRQLARSRGERKDAMNTKRVWETQVNEPQSVSALFDGLVSELDNDDVTAIILHGSYARGDAVPLHTAMWISLDS